MEFLREDSLYEYFPPNRGSIVRLFAKVLEVTSLNLVLGNRCSPGNSGSRKETMVWQRYPSLLLLLPPMPLEEPQLQQRRVFYDSREVCWLTWRRSVQTKVELVGGIVLKW